MLAPAPASTAPLCAAPGEVFWTWQGETKLPDEIIKRFDGKVMAITGYEQDQVMVTPVGKPGVNPEQDVSFPINWAYNHHVRTNLNHFFSAPDGEVLASGGRSPLGTPAGPPLCWPP